MYNNLKRDIPCRIIIIMIISANAVKCIAAFSAINKRFTFRLILNFYQLGFRNGSVDNFAITVFFYIFQGCYNINTTIINLEANKLVSNLIDKNSNNVLRRKFFCYLPIPELSSLRVTRWSSTLLKHLLHKQYFSSSTDVFNE